MVSSAAASDGWRVRQLVGMVLFCNGLTGAMATSLHIANTLTESTALAPMGAELGCAAMGRMGRSTVIAERRGTSRMTQEESQAKSLKWKTQRSQEPSVCKICGVVIGSDRSTARICSEEKNRNSMLLCASNLGWWENEAQGTWNKVSKSDSGIKIAAADACITKKDALDWQVHFGRSHDSSKQPRSDRG